MRAMRRVVESDRPLGRENCDRAWIMRFAYRDALLDSKV